MSRRISGVASVILSLCFPLVCLAALYIDDTSTTDAGHLDLEFSADYYKDIEKEFNEETEEYDKTIYKETCLTESVYYGLTGRWDVSAYFPYQFLDQTTYGKVNGFTDFTLETKFRFADEGKKFPSFAMSYDLKLDNGNDIRGLGTGRKDHYINAIFTKGFGRNIFDFNLGYTFVGGAADDILSTAFDWTYAFNDKLYLCNEIYADTILRGTLDDNTLCLASSISYDFSSFISAEAGVGFGISKASPDYQYSGTVTFSF